MELSVLNYQTLCIGWISPSSDKNAFILALLSLYMPQILSIDLGSSLKLFN